MEWNGNKWSMWHNQPAFSSLDLWGQRVHNKLVEIAKDVHARCLHALIQCWSRLSTESSTALEVQLTDQALHI